jgi:LCP family protein required for cell wall assembly
MARWKAVVLVVVLAVLAGGAGLGVHLKRQFDAIPRFEASPSEGSGEGTQEGGVTITDPAPTAAPAAPDLDPETFLLFSLGSDGVDPADGDRLGVGVERAEMSDGLTDTLMLVVVNPDEGRASVIGIPRDTWVPARKSKINALYKAHGVGALSEEVTRITGFEVDHQVAVNFTAFADVTDAIGGVSLDFPVPVRDPQAGLLVEEPGCRPLNGAGALSVVRSRHWEVFIDGKWRSDPSSSDFGRIERQQIYLRAVLEKVLGPSLVKSVPSLMGVAQDNIVLDEGFGVTDAADLARAFQGVSSGAVEMAQLPATPGRVGKASVVFLDEEGSASVLARAAEVLRGVPSASPSATEPPVLTPPSGTAVPAPAPSETSFTGSLTQPKPC